MRLGDDDRKTKRVQQRVFLELIVLTLGMYFQTVCHSITMRYHRGCIKQACEGKGTLVPLNKFIWILIGEYSIARVLICSNVDPIRGLVAVARS